MRRRLIALLALMLVLAPAWGQVEICYDFEDAIPDTRPMGWGALPNLDFHYVGVGIEPVHTGSKSLYNNGTTCYTIMPDEGLNYGADSVWLTFWYYLHNNTDFFEVGYLTDASDSSTFHVLDTVHEWSQEWHFHAVDLSSVPTGARIAFFGHDIFSSDGTFWIDNIHLTSTPCAAWGLRVAENREDSVRLEWESAGDPTVTVTINWNTPYDVTGNSFTFARDYYNSFMSELIAQCPYSGCMAIQPHSYMYIPRYREGTCLDASDFNSTMAMPYYGTPVEPYLHTGTYTTTTPGITGIWAGSHTINTNPGSDGGGMMVFPRTIPPGDASTLRLGNRLGDWESASMLYTIDVDTNETDLLVMKYTVAMAFGTFQGPEVAHRSDTLHPAWFRIELLDDTMAQVQPATCNLFFIDMWDTAGWDEMNSMYKRRNFTGMAFDLAPYHGQRLHLRVTTCDGVVNNRWCYAYYNFECLKRNDYTDACTDGDSVTFTMPYGFNYRWWRAGETTTFSTEQRITVVPDSTHYLCELVDRFNPECSQTVSRWALARPQRWERDTVVENQLPYTWHGITFTNAGDTSLILPSNTGCDTTLILHLHVWPNQNIRIEHPVCPGDWPIVWQEYTFTRPDSVTFTVTDSHGADSTVTFVAVEALTYEVTDTVVICPGNPFEWGGIDFGGPVTFDTLLTSVDGCDSLVHVAIVLRDSTFRLHALHSIDLLHWADSIPIMLCDNQTLYAVDSTESSTTWQWHVDDLPASSTSQQTEFTFDSTDRMPESHLITLITSSPGGCVDTLEWPVVVFPSPSAEFIWTPNHPADISPETQLINYSQPNNCHWLWLVQNANENTEYDSLDTFEPIYRWQDNMPGNFDVQLVAYLTTPYDTLVHTCTDTAKHTIEVVTAWLDFPNLVTPNGDGVNDTWEVVNLVELGQYSMNEIWIYDRDGACVFHARNIRRHEQFWNPNTPWCPDGTYYYRFMARNAHGLVRHSGVIEVLR
ncbi:MAG: gliding motility-associated C-terminal domain-containing protein [Bacteroidales bacterium]|nr:gliding motility-associated C-terminal domain-containing protein [Bacteroidales bacterium]